MTSFADALNAEQAAFRKGPRCSIAITLDTLDPDEAADLAAALAAHPDRVAHSWIARALKSIGHSINVESVRRHRKGDCTCATP